MVLDAAAHLVSRNLSTSNWLLKLLVPVAAAGVLRTYSAGFVCRDDRNLHDKTYILVGCFSGPGLSLMQSLASRGAQIIALHPDPSSDRVLQLCLLLRGITSNERIYADECSIGDMGSIRKFVQRWEKDGRSGMVGDLATRLDGIIFCDGEGTGMEGVGYGVPQAFVDSEEGERLDLYHSSLVLSRHALVQLLLPTLVRSASTSSAPVRVISQVSPFYATASSSFLSSLDSPIGTAATPWLPEGQASLAAIVLMRELQERVNGKNILVISTCGGFTRAWIHRTLRATSNHPQFSWAGWILSWLLLPFVWCLCKTADEASQVLLAAVLSPPKSDSIPQVATEGSAASPPNGVDPAGVKVRKQSGDVTPPTKLKLRGGSLYREGLEVRVPSLATADANLGENLWEVESKRVEFAMKQVIAREATSGEGASAGFGAQYSDKLRSRKGN